MDVTPGRARVAGAVEVLTGAGGASYDDVRDAGGWSLLDTDTPNYGFSPEAYWFRIHLHNPTGGDVERMIEVAYPPLDHLSLYAVEPDGSVTHYETGDALPFDHRPVDRRTFVFPVAVPAGTTVPIFLRVASESSVQVPLRVWSPTAFLDHTYTNQLWLGAFYGLMLIMILYNLFVYASVRDASFLYFCLFVAGYVCIQAGLDGLSYQYLWPNAPGLNAVAMPIAITGGSALGVAFSRRFLQLATILPRWDRVCGYLTTAGAAICVLALLVPYSLAVRVATAYAAVVILLLMAAGPRALRAGFRSARFYVLAWAAFLLGSISLILGKFGLLPANLATLRGPQLGAALEVLLFSLALADRINILQREARAAQREALEAQLRATERLQEEVDARTAELRDQADRLRELDAQKTRFFQNVSHELRTPLTLILSSSDELCQSPTLAQDDRIALVDKNARRLLRLVNELLDFQKLAAGRKQLARAPIDLVAFLHSCAEYVRPACEPRDIELALELPESERVVVEAEADALEKVAFNYLSNALKHTPKGGRISVGLTVDADAEVAELTVSDSGRGIAESDRSRLFQVFSQLDDDKARKAGSGLGLALVRELVEAHGGEVGVDSEVGRGSRFWARLPLAPSGHASLTTVALSPWELDVGAPDSDAAVETTGEFEDKPGSVILVVDDLPDMRALVRRTLDRQGYDTVGTSNGARALDVARKLKPQLIVTDWMMPELTGPELIERLRADPDLAGTPVVLLTAKTDDESRTTAVQIGADAFLGKPFDELELSSIVRNLLALKARERELERAQQAKEELTRFVIHDLKNPLTVIAANVDLMLEDRSLDDDARESLVAVQQATESTHRMVLNLLDISRSEDGHLEPRLEPIATAELAGELDTTMTRWLQRKNQRLDIDMRTNELVADRSLVRRILENLIENAAKHSPPGEPIRVELERDGAAVVLRVRDRGPGVPEAARATVFDKYAQVDRGHAAPGSHGLGLQFCRLAAEAHGGSIGVDDNEPTGACFWVRLPQRRSSQRRPSWPDQVHSARPSE